MWNNLGLSTATSMLSKIIELQDKYPDDEIVMRLMGDIYQLMDIFQSSDDALQAMEYCINQLQMNWNVAKENIYRG